MCSIVWDGAPQGHAMSAWGSGEGCLLLRKWVVYSPVKVCPVMNLNIVEVSVHEALAVTS